jgi:hypothetical protein
MKRIGYGQVEPNHLSAQRNGQIYAQLPANSEITVLENGMFAKYDYAAKEVNFTGDGEWLLVYNEVKVYDTLRESTKDFAMKKENCVSGVMVPRLLATHVGDIFTTNMTSDWETVTYVGGEYLAVTAGKLAKVESKPATGMAWKVVKVYTMPDGQDGIKIQRIQ